MEKLIFLLPLLFLNAACDQVTNLVNLPATLNDMNGTMKDMSSTTNQMNNGMKTTNVGIHNQTLKDSMDGLMDKSNWDELNPAPFKLMPYGKAFAEEATEEELMLFFQATLKELNESKLDLGTDLQTGDTLPYIAGSTQLNDAMQEKMIKLTILSIIAGFTPQSSIDQDPTKPQKDIVGQIISHEIVGDSTVGSGEFSNEAIAFLALRATFIHDILLVNVDLAQPLNNIGKVEHALNLAVLLDYIATRPNAVQIQAIVKPQFHVASAVGSKPAPVTMDLTTVLDTTEPLAIWKSIRTGIDRDLLVGVASVGVDQATAAARAQNEQQREQAASKTVNQYLTSWTPAAKHGSH